MGKVLVTGDVHRSDIERFSRCENLTKDDVMIILGDWGAIWYGESKYQTIEHKSQLPPNYCDDEILDYWQKLPFTTFVVLGNHENYDMIARYPYGEKFDGAVQQVRPSVYLAVSGEVYDINGIKCFVMNGAPSIDKCYRIEHYSWWKQEIPTSVDFNRGLDRLDECGWDVDYVLSHEAPDYVLSCLGYEHNIISNYLDVVDSKLIDCCLRFKHHYFGHHHIDRDFGNKATCLYYEIKELKI